MKPKLDVLRALSAVIAMRAITLTRIVGFVVFALLFVGIWALGSYVSPWWWLLLIVYIPLLVAVLAVLFVAQFLVRKLYPVKLSREQKRLLTNFTDKIQGLVEARGMGWWWFMVLNVKDIVLHRDVVTTKKLLADTTSLARDFKELEEKLR